MRAFCTCKISTWKCNQAMGSDSPNGTHRKVDYVQEEPPPERRNDLNQWSL